MVNPNDPAEKELGKLMEDDDAALAEVDRWIQTNNALVAAGAGESKEALNQRIRARLDTVRTNYAAFLRRHPDSARGFLAYGSFLDDIGDEEAGKVQFENAAQIDPKNPAVWNNLANYYGENGAVTNAFADYARAIELDPTEPMYYQNFATTVYLYRKDAREFYGITGSRFSTRRWNCIGRPSSLPRMNFTARDGLRGNLLRHPTDAHQRRAGGVDKRAQHRAQRSRARRRFHPPRTGQNRRRAPRRGPRAA